MLSVPSFSEKRSAIHFENNVFTLLYQGELYSTSALRNGIFELDCQEPKACTVKTTAVLTRSPWSFDTGDMLIMTTKDLVAGINISECANDSQLWVSCIKRKF